MDEEEKNTESMTKELIDKFFDEVRDIVLLSKDKDEAMEKLEKLRERQSDVAGNLNDLYDMAEDYIDDGVKTPEDRKKFLGELGDIKFEKEQNIKSDQNAAAQQAMHNSVVDEIANETGYDTATINEVLQDDENGVDFDEELTDDDPQQMAEVSNGPYKLKRPDKEKIKKLYKYKVEGKITSGIKDLDTFLGIIQPAINLLIIEAWKPIFWAMDKKDAAFESLDNWQKRKKDLAEGWKTLEALGAVPNGKKFSWAQNVEEQEDEMAGYFNKYMCDKMNKLIVDNQQNTLRNKYNDAYDKFTQNGLDDSSAKRQALQSMNDYKNSDEFKNYESPNRTDLFDTKKPPRWSRITIDSEFLNLFRLKDKDGKIIARDDKGNLTKEGKSLMKGYSILLDLFNKKNKGDFVDNFTRDIPGLMKDAGREEWDLMNDRKVKRIEDMDITAYMKAEDDEAEKAKDSNDILKRFSELIGKSK